MQQSPSRTLQLNLQNANKLEVILHASCKNENFITQNSYKLTLEIS